MDTLTREQRSAVMARVRSKDTGPEMTVRRLVYAMGYRYRLHDGSLPGRPDLVFKGRRKVIFVHGCFWHLHEHCPNNRPPKSRTDFWNPKLARNRERDIENERRLRNSGWEVLTIWECEINDIDTLEKRIREFLG